MKFDVVFTNPPFQDTTKRNSTPHKLWIEFTVATFDRLIKEDGLLCQVSPASFGSPSNKVLDLMREHQTQVLRYNTEHHFRNTELKPGSSFSDYAIKKSPSGSTLTDVVTARGSFQMKLDESIWYLPNDLSPMSLGIHQKVIFRHSMKLPVEWDYVTCHNINRFAHRSKYKRVTLSEEPHADFPFAAYHTSNTCWWSSVEPECLRWPKVIWSRSGYMKPFADEGRYGVTDMSYFVRVGNLDEAKHLAHNLSLNLIRYISLTAKWSGFGNERVFCALPDLPRDRALTNEDLYALFRLSAEEVKYVEAFLAPKGRRRTKKT